jgi:nucleotide-binding universal stress UspA family protein
MLQRILVVWNGSPAAEEALQTATALARSYDAAVGVLAVGVASDIPAEAGAPSEFAILESTSAGAIARYALDHGADLLVIGRDGVAAELVRIAPVPLLVIPG